MADCDDPFMDWSEGQYELAAAQLLPAAEILVDLAAPKPGEIVVDVGCGTGNAALLAARRGATVTGVDPAPRLLEVTRERAATEGLEVIFVDGTAEATSLEAGVADVVISSFGVMFAPDVPAAVAELDRMTGPGGRVLVTSFPPGGPMNAIAGAAWEEISQVLGPMPSSDSDSVPFGWHDEADLRSTFEPRGFSVSVETHEFPVIAPSVPAYIESTERHPSAVMGMRAIADNAVRDDVGLRIRRRLTEVLESLNEDPTAFRMTSPFTVATMRRIPS